MFSTRVTGILRSRKVCDSGTAELPRLIGSTAEPSHAASIACFSMPASLNASENDSRIRSSEPQSQRSPKREQPMPRIATLSRMPDAMSARRRGGCFPEIGVVVAQAVDLLLAIDGAHVRADRKVFRIEIDELHQHARAGFELHEAEAERRRAFERQPIRGERDDLGALAEQRHGFLLADVLALRVDADAGARKLHSAAFRATAGEES